MVFLNDIPCDNDAAAKAERICGLTRKSMSIGADITVSVGIAIAPRDGIDFNTLYRNADRALYSVKATTKDGYAFYCDGV